EDRFGWVAYRPTGDHRRFELLPIVSGSPFDWRPDAVKPDCTELSIIRCSAQARMVRTYSIYDQYE
ncbi:hypothetical protein L195_g060214, partial [Trifolium pratense]